MVSKRNRQGNKSRKTAEKVVQPAEKPAEVNVEQLLTIVTQKVVEVLKPDLEQKVTAVQTTLSNQIKAEMQDLREHLPTITPPSTEQPQTEQPQTPEGTPQTPDPLSQINPQSQNGQLANTLLPLLMQAIKPANPNNELMSMYMQTAMRKEMSKATMTDWLQEAVMKKFANDFLQTEYPTDVKATQDHLMKPLRDMGVRAMQNAHMKQESEKKQ